MQIAPGIYRDRIGYAVAVNVGSGPTRLTRERRYPKGTDLATMKTWRDETRVKLGQQRLRRQGGERESLAYDIQVYLTKHAGVEFLETRKIELAAWVPEFGDRRRRDLKTPELDACLRDWRAGGLSASTCNHRRNALSQLWKALDGPDAPNPVAHTTHFREPSGEPREIPADALDELMAAMPPSKTRAMYRLMVETGWPPARIRRILPEHVNWRTASVYLVDRRKGKGTVGKTYPLNARALAAMREFHEQHAYGGVTRQSIGLVFDRARNTVNRTREIERRPTLSAALRPYDARHTIGVQLVRQTGDIYGTAEFLGVSVQTALRYTRAAVPQLMRSAADALDALRGAPPAQTPTAPRPHGNTVKAARVRAARSSRKEN